MDENMNTIDSEFEWEKPAADLNHVKSSNEKKQEGLEELVDEGGMSELRSRSTVVPPRISTGTTCVKTNSTDAWLTTEKTTLANVTATSPHPASTAKKDSLEASPRFKEKNGTEVLGYWDLLLSWLPRV